MMLGELWSVVRLENLAEKSEPRARLVAPLRKTLSAPRASRCAPEKNANYNAHGGETWQIAFFNFTREKLNARLRSRT